MRVVALMLLVLAGSCRTAVTPGQGDGPGDAFWRALQPFCGKAFEGRLVEGTEPSDAEIGRQRLVMHVRQCSASEIRIPFHVGANQSRTWVLTRLPNGVRLKHDHRHEDGTEDRISQYGGDTRGDAGSLSLDFFADAFTGTLIPAAATNIWTMTIDDNRRTFSYGLRREGRRFRVEFDLTKEVASASAVKPDPGGLPRAEDLRR